MSKTGDHAEDIEHELEHAGREVGQEFADAVTEPEDPADSALIDADED